MSSARQLDLKSTASDIPQQPTLPPKTEGPWYSYKVISAELKKPELDNVWNNTKSSFEVFITSNVSTKLQIYKDRAISDKKPLSDVLFEEFEKFCNPGKNPIKNQDLKKHFNLMWNAVVPEGLKEVPQSSIPAVSGSPSNSGQKFPMEEIPKVTAGLTTLRHIDVQWRRDFITWLSSPGFNLDTFQKDRVKAFEDYGTWCKGLGKGVDIQSRQPSFFEMRIAALKIIESKET